MAVLQPPPWSTAAPDPCLPRQPSPSEAALWREIGHCERPALLELFRRHGEAAFLVCWSITQNAERAKRAVLASFVLLATQANRRADMDRALRVEVLDAARRCAGLFADPPPDTQAPEAGSPDHEEHHSPGPSVVFGSVPPRVRDVLALAVAGRCGCAEIGQIMGCDAADVHRDLLVGLEQARAALGPAMLWPEASGSVLLESTR